MRRKLLSLGSVTWIGGHLISLLIGLLLIIGGSRLQGSSGQPSLIVGVMQAIGASLMAAGVAGQILYLNVVAAEGGTARLENLAKSGLTNAFPARSIQIREEYDRRIVHAKNVDILGFGLSSFRQDHAKDFVSWSKRSHIRILLIDPAFPSPHISYVSQRDREEGNSPGDIARDVEAFLSECRKLTDLDKTKFEIHLSRTLPSVNIFRMDDDILWGPYLISDQSRNMPTFVASRGGYLFDRLTSHFDTIWSRPDLSLPVDL